MTELSVSQQQAMALPADVLPSTWLLQQIQPFSAPEQMISSFSQAFDSLEFGLGETLMSLDSGHQADCFLVCQGRVRLLGYDASKQREVSIQVLTEGETLGGESLWQGNPLPYRAIAASPVRLARIPLDQLQPWLERFPNLHQTWLAAVQHRQALIFFKTLTVLRSLSSHRLQPILLHLSEKRIAAGEYLSEATPADTGHFWLRQGKVENSPLEIGSSWGHPATIPADWLAQTDLWVYQLPQNHWQDAQSLFPSLAEIVGAPTQIQSGIAVPISNPNSNSKGGSLAPVLPTPPPRFPPPSSEPQVIDFPKPLKHQRRWWDTFPLIEQQSAADCGAACLAMVSQYWGKRLSLNFLRNLTGVGQSGASLKNLAKASESLGYQARPVRASLSRLIEQQNPWIAHWQGDHYVVVYPTKDNRLLIADPAHGKRFMSRQEFSTGWTGYALLLDPTERLKEMPTEKRSLGRFFVLLLPYRVLGTQIILASLLIHIFGLVTPLFTQIILDQVVVNKSLSTLNVFIIGVLLFGIWGVLISAIRQYLLSYLSNRLDLTMISGFISHTLRLPLKFFESRHVGDILTRVNENEKIQRFLISQVVLAWLDFLMGFVYLGLMFYYNWRLTLLVIFLIPPIALLTLASTPFLRQVSREVFSKSAEQNSSLVETMTGVATVKATASEQELRWRWEENLTGFLNARFRGQKLGINLQAASSGINTLGSAALLWYGATLVIQGQLTIGQLVAFNMLIAKVLSPVLSLSNLWDELQEVLVSVERLDDVFSAEPEETPGKPRLLLPSLRGDVQFENVTFRYNAEEDSNTLQNISFSVSAGETIAIVGRSGSGKSTLVKLLQALYQPLNGHIWIDGHDIRHVSTHSLRSQLGVVPQECFLFSGTILENITLFRTDFSLEQAVEVAKLAEAHAFIQSMPLGYNTKVGERGTNLSGGQRQRLAIARALLGKPRILLLDEATSSLDTESERRFQQNLARLSRDRTTFIIAHRLSTVRNADCILVLDHGILLEKGTHEELMLEQGLYYHLAQQQLDL